MSRIEVIHPAERDRGTVQTSGMVREAGISPETGGTKTLWTGYVRGEPGLASGTHHHGDCETAIYVLSGRAPFHFGPKLEQVLDSLPRCHHVRQETCFHFGPKLEQVLDVQAGDFLFVPPNEVHVEEN